MLIYISMIIMTIVSAPAIATGLYSFFRSTALMRLVRVVRPRGKSPVTMATADLSRKSPAAQATCLSVGLSRDQKNSSKNQLLIRQVTEFRSQEQANLSDCFQ